MQTNPTSDRPGSNGALTQKSLTFEEALSGLHAAIDRLLDADTPLRVLDAGCGGQMYLRLASEAHIVGIDVSPTQLERNTTVDERILGDIQTFPLSPASFDIAVCWDVLEHLPRPREALENLQRALRPGGLLVLGGPNALSLKGLATWITPLWFHRLLYRRSSVAAPESSPFKTYRRFAALPDQVTTWADDWFAAKEYFVAYESPLQLELRERAHMTGQVWWTIQGSLRRLTRGRVDLAATDFMLVLRR